MFFFMALCLLSFFPLTGANAQSSAVGPNQAVSSQLTRSIDELFPGLSQSQKDGIFSPGGLIQSHKKNEALLFVPAPGSGIDLLSAVMGTNPSFFAESLLVVPYQGKTLDRLDVYNALGRIRDLKGRLYRSFTRNAEVPLFEDATRIDSVQKNNPIPDPQRSMVLPLSETVYIRLKDVNFGNTFYRGDISTGPYGVTYKLSNSKNISYLFFTVMKEGKFTAMLYMEPLAEGMLIYSMAGAETSDFVSGRIDIPSAISKRLGVFIAWISDGLKSL